MDLDSAVHRGCTVLGSLICRVSGVATYMFANPDLNMYNSFSTTKRKQTLQNVASQEVEVAAFLLFRSMWRTYIRTVCYTKFEPEL